MTSVSLRPAGAVSWVPSREAFPGSEEAYSESRHFQKLGTGES